MSDKKFTPEEVAVAVLKKSQEIYNKHSDLKKSEELEKASSNSKKDDKEKGVHKPHYMAGKNTGTSEVGAYQGGSKLGADTLSYAKDKHKEIMEESKKIKPNLPKSEEIDKCGEMKVVDKTEEEKEETKDSKKSKKLPEFLKKKFMKKSMGSAPVAPEAAKGTASQSPQSPSIATQIGWPNSGKSEK